MNTYEDVRAAQYRGLRDMVRSLGEERAFMLVAKLKAAGEPEKAYGFAIGWEPKTTPEFPTQLQLGSVLLELAVDWRFNPSDFDSASRGLVRAIILTHIGVPTLDPKKMPKTPPSEAEMERQWKQYKDLGPGYAYILKALRPNWLGVECVYDMADTHHGPREITPVLRLPEEYR